MAVEIPKSFEAIPTSELRWVGRSVNRVEDPKLVTDRTELIDDVSLPGMLHCATLHSPFAHACVVRVDANAVPMMLFEPSTESCTGSR